MKECYIGTYSSDGGEGVYSVAIDDGVLSPPKLCFPAKNSKYLYCEKGLIYSLFDGDRSGVAVYNESGNLLDSLEFEDTTSCYIIKYGEFIYTANYHTGDVSKLSFVDNKLTLISQIEIQEKAGCHQVLLVDDKILVPCLLIDKIYILNTELEVLDIIEMPLRSGPRHGVVSHDKKYYYLVGELSDKLYTFSIEDDKFILVHEISILPPNSDPVSNSAAIRMSDDGMILMMSVRTLNIITIADIRNGIPRILNYVSTEGDHPRDILNLDDKYLLVANRLSNTLVLFLIDQYSMITKSAEVSINGAVALCIMEE